MQTLHPSHVERPRVGVSGAVTVAPERLDRLREQVVEALAIIHDEVLSRAKTKAAQQVYDPGSQPPRRLISALAEGADRLVAKAALKNFQHATLSPFDAAAYQVTFTQDPHELRGPSSRPSRN